MEKINNSHFSDLSQSRRDLFATPLWTFEVGESSSLNELLESDLSKIKTGEDYHPRLFNLFDYPGDGIVTLKNIMLEVSDQLIGDREKEVDMNQFFGKVSCQNQFESKAPHTHGNASFVMVYYLRALPNQGDLLLHDPRGYSSWGSYQEGDASGRICHRIVPKSGDMVVFPASLPHSVETNFSPISRISIAVTISMIDSVNKLKPKFYQNQEVATR